MLKSDMFAADFAAGIQEGSMRTAKAIVAAATTLLGTVGTVIADGEVSAEEVGVVVAAVLVAYGAVYQVRNIPS